MEHFFLQPGSHGLLVLPKFLVSLCASNLSYLLDVRLLKHFTCNFRIRAQQIPSYQLYDGIHVPKPKTCAEQKSTPETVQALFTFSGGNWAI